MVIEIIIQNFNIQIFDDSLSEQYRYNIRGTTELALITGSAAVCRYASTVPAVAGQDNSYPAGGGQAANCTQTMHTTHLSIFSRMLLSYFI